MIRCRPDPTVAAPQTRRFWGRSREALEATFVAKEKAEFGMAGDVAGR
jgi:hypothetical protein